MRASRRAVAAGLPSRAGQAGPARRRRPVRRGNPSAARTSTGWRRSDRLGAEARGRRPSGHSGPARRSGGTRLSRRTVREAAHDERHPYPCRGSSVSRRGEPAQWGRGIPASGRMGVSAVRGGSWGAGPHTARRRLGRRAYGRGYQGIGIPGKRRARGRRANECGDQEEDQPVPPEGPWAASRLLALTLGATSDHGRSERTEAGRRVDQPALARPDQHCARPTPRHAVGSHLFNLRDMEQPGR